MIARRGIVGLALATILLGGLGIVFADGPREVRRIVVIHTNDLHGQVLPARDGVGGADAIAGYIRAERERARNEGDGFLLVDAGDLWAGTPEGTLTEGRVVVDVWNRLAYDVMTVGNHEFDRGLESLVALEEMADFPWLAANLHTESGERPDWVRPWIVLEAAGVRLGVIGLIDRDTPSMTLPAATEGLVFGDEAEAARRAIPEVREAGADVVILLTHCGRETDVELAGELDGVTAIIGGHSHTPLLRGIRDPETGCLVCQAGSKGRWVGRLVLEVDAETGEVVGSEERLVEMDRDEVPLDEEIASAVASWNEEIAARMDVAVGRVDSEIPRHGGLTSSPLGNFITDVMLDVSGADLALHNKTGIRADLEEGDVTRRNLFEVSPFGNTIVTLTFTGEELLEELEYAFGASIRHLEMSGVRVGVDPEASEGERVEWVRVDGEPLDPDATYRVATNNFLADGGDGHLFPAGSDPVDTGIGVFEATMQALEDGSPVAPSDADRVEIVEGEPAPEDSAEPASEPEPVGAGADR